MTTHRVTISSAGLITGTGPFPLTGLPAVLLLGNDGTATISAPQIVPVRPLAAQRVSSQLNGQSCVLNLAFKDLIVPDMAEIPTDPPPFIGVKPLFMDIYLTQSTGAITGILAGVLCENNSLIIRNRYLGFVGDLAFVDTQGNADPEIDGLGTRWLLTYWPELP